MISAQGLRTFIDLTAECVLPFHGACRMIVAEKFSSTSAARLLVVATICARHADNFTVLPIDCPADPTCSLRVACCGTILNGTRNDEGLATYPRVDLQAAGGHRLSINMYYLFSARLIHASQIRSSVGWFLALCDPLWARACLFIL